jgi:hypothetical protein
VRRILNACLLLMAALWVTGLVTGAPIRHLIQTIPIWFGVGLSLAEKRVGKWAALALCFFWLAMQIVIWASLAGLIGSPVTIPLLQIALSVAVAAASVYGMVCCFRFTSGTPWFQSIAVFAVTGLMQLAAFLLSVLPQYAAR